MIFKTVMKLYAVELCKIPQPDVLYSYCCLQLPVGTTGYIVMR